MAGNTVREAAAVAADDKDLAGTSSVDAFAASCQSCNLATVADADSHAVIRAMKLSGTSSCLHRQQAMKFLEVVARSSIDSVA